MYKDNAETIAGCCSTMLFLGGKEESSLKMVSGLLGKETIDTMNESDSVVPGHLRSELSEAGQGIDERGRTGGHAVQPLYRIGAGRSSLLLQEV